VAQQDPSEQARATLKRQDLEGKFIRVSQSLLQSSNYDAPGRHIVVPTASPHGYNLGTGAGDPRAEPVISHVSMDFIL